MEAWASAFSAATSLAAFLISYLSWRAAQREKKLRDSDVLAWAHEGIDQLQTLELTLAIWPDDAANRLNEISYGTSRLVERGRLFFKNEVINNFGAEKSPAYRGYRPVILDQLVIGHQIACKAVNADNELRQRFCRLSQDALRTFVSLAQQEVGRSRTAAVVNKAGGSGINVEWMAQELSRTDLPPIKRESL